VYLYNVVEVLLEGCEYAVLRGQIQNRRVGIDCMHYSVCSLLEYEMVQTAQILPLLFVVKYLSLKLQGDTFALYDTFDNTFELSSAPALHSIFVLYVQNGQKSIDL